MSEQVGRALSLRVWAPAAERVDAVLGDDRRLPMAPAGAGWWATAEPVAAGTDYHFSLDGAAPLPDPRSRWQPDGVDGPSRVVDPAAFEWTDDRWQPPPLAAGVVYELHVGTFSEAGTFDGAIEHLDHLVQLGVTHVELMPVNQFPGRHGWGYDGVDLYAVHAAYGGPHGLVRLVDACHARGLAVLLDVVYNHLGPAGNYLGRYGPYFTDRHSTPWGDAVNFDGPGSDEVRRFFVDNALMWLADYHVDGLRLDAVHAIVDTSAVHILEQLATEVDALEAAVGRHKVLIAESDLNDPRLIRPVIAGGYGLDAQWSDDFHHALHSLLTGERSGYYADFGTAAELATALREAYVYGGAVSEFRGRRHGRPAGDLPGWRFLGYLQNHDQVGNRALGERSAALMSEGRLKIGAAVVMCAPFVPMLFQGEEWAAGTPFQYFTDHPDAELGRAVSTGRREEFAAFGWEPDSVPDPQATETFERSKLSWSERDGGTHARLLAWHRSLIELRRSTPDLLDGRRDLAETRRRDDGTFWLRRQSIAVAFNIGSAAARVELPSDSAELVLASDPTTELAAGALSLPPDSVAILRLG